MLRKPRDLNVACHMSLAKLDDLYTACWHASTDLQLLTAALSPLQASLRLLPFV